MISLSVVFFGRSLKAANDLAAKLQQQGFSTQIPNPARGRVVAEVEYDLSVSKIITTLSGLSSDGFEQVLIRSDAWIGIDLLDRKNDIYLLAISSDECGSTLILRFKKPVVNQEQETQVMDDLRYYLITLVVAVVGRYANQALGLLDQNEPAGVRRKLEGIQKACVSALMGDDKPIQ